MRIDDVLEDPRYGTSVPRFTLTPGLPAVRSYLAGPWGGDVVLLALTGWGQPDDLRRSFDAGFDHHVVKPLHAARLAPLLERRRRGPS